MTLRNLVLLLVLILTDNFIQLLFYHNITLANFFLQMIISVEFLLQGE